MNFRCIQAICTSVFILSLTTEQAIFAAVNAKITVTATDLDAFCGTHNVKVVFVNREKLYWVDFNEATPAIHMFTTSETGGGSPKLPVISPDGKYVVYTTAALDDGLRSNPKSNAVLRRIDNSARGDTIVKDSGFVPRFVQNATKPTVVYSTYATHTAAQNPYLMGRTRTREVMVSSTTNTPGTDQVIWAGGSYYGGMSYDNKYLATAWLGSSMGVYMIDRQGSTPPRRVDSFAAKIITSQKDTVLTGSSGCNPSVSSSRIFTNMMMYFDFGNSKYDNGLYSFPAYGGLWGFHQKLLIARSDGIAMRQIDFPAQWPEGALAMEWDNPEWSNHPYYAAATFRINRMSHRLVDSSDYHEQIQLIDLKRIKYLKLIETTDTFPTSTTDMKWPSVWIDTGAGFVEDAHWLDTTLVQKSNGVVRRTAGRSSSQNAVQFENGSLLSQSAITSVELFTALGDLVANVNVHGARKVSLQGWQQKYKGIFFVKAHTTRGGTSVFRWVL